MPEMTPLEAGNLADALEKSLPPKVSYANLVGAESCYGDTYVWEDPEPYMISEAIQFLRKIAAGEYRQVVHGHWKNRGYLDQCCSICGEAPEREQGETPPDYDICPYCGALMDGKDDSHE